MNDEGKKWSILRYNKLNNTFTYSGSLGKGTILAAPSPGGSLMDLAIEEEPRADDGVPLPPAAPPT